MGNMKVSTRLSLGFGILIALLAMIVVLGLSRMSALNGSSQTLVDNGLPKVLDVAYRAVDNARVTRNIILLTDMKAMAANKETFDKNLALIEENMVYLEKHLNTAAEREHLKLVNDTRAPYVSLMNDVIKLGLENKNEEAAKLLYGERYATQAAHLGALRKFVDAERAKMEDEGKDAQRTFDSARTLMLVLGLIACVVSVALAVAITRGLARQLGGEPAYAASVARSIAEGNLMVEVETRAGDSSSLLAAMKVMRDSLVKVVATVRHGSESVASASQQIASGNHDLSGRTESQPSAIPMKAPIAAMVHSTARCGPASKSATRAGATPS